MIGLSAALLMAVHGRIAGVSGLVAGVLSPVRGEWAWRAAFLGGLFAAPIVYRVVAGAPPALETPHGDMLTIAGGFLVGIGVRMGAGCTSGHGVCGLARLSKRSLAATATFMATAIAAVFVLRQLLGV